MRNMSFSLTTPQILDRSKTVTRRMGWKSLKPGDRIRAVKKAMGLKKGEKIEQLAVLEVVSIRREPLSQMSERAFYGRDEIIAEGFQIDPTDRVKPQVRAWVSWFAESHKCHADALVTRIEFKYVDEPGETR